MQFLLHISVLALAVSSQFFPYSTDAPKRVILQHTILTTGGDQILDSSYDFSVVDSNSLRLVFEHAPEVTKELEINSPLSFNTVNISHKETWVGIFPISSLFSRSLKFPTKSDGFSKQYKYFPNLSTSNPAVPELISGEGTRRVHLDFSLGSLKEVWVAVLNITGPLSSWSLANGVLPATERIEGGPPSYICRLSGASDENWTFWLEANSSEALRVEVAVIDQHLTEDTKKLKSLFPNWMDVTAFSSFLSSYTF